jgi:23S rRNA pseudouridine1911/1915/1917 synthase
MPGELVQGDRTGDLCLADKAKAHIKECYSKPGDVYLGVVHRLDRPVGGVLLFARTSKAAARLSTAFQKRMLIRIRATLYPREHPVPKRRY